MADPVSWLLIEPGWKVLAADGSEVGTVAEVTGDTGADIFDGLEITTGVVSKPRYVPAERVGKIEEGTVHLSLEAAQVEELPEPRSP